MSSIAHAGATSGTIVVTALDSNGNVISPQPTLTATSSNTAVLTVTSTSTKNNFLIKNVAAGKATLSFAVAGESASSTSRRSASFKRFAKDVTIPITGGTVTIQSIPVLALYVASGGGSGTINEYLPGVSSPFSTIQDTNTKYAGQVALDSYSNVYVANDVDTFDSTVSVYGPGAGSGQALATANYSSDGVIDPQGIEIDSSGNVDICDAAQGGADAIVNQFLPGTVSGATSIIDLGSPNTNYSCSGMAINANNDIFLSERGNNVVYGYAPNGSGGYNPTPYMTINIPSGGFGPSALAEDTNGDLFIADGTQVLEYSQGNQGTPMLTIPTAGLAVALAVDANNNLYVGLQNEVDVYAPGATSPSSSFTGLSNVGGITVVPGAVQ